MQCVPVGLSDAEAWRAVAVCRHGSHFDKPLRRVRVVGELRRGTVEPEHYLEMLRGAGFERVELVTLTDYKTAATTSGAISAPKSKGSHAEPQVRPGT